MKKLLYVLGVSLLLIFSIQTAHASTFPDGCTATTAYSSTTGHPCSQTLPDCNVGDLYSAVTGRPCTQQTYLPGCTSTIGYSVTTGKKCDGSTPLQQISQQLNQIIQNTSPATPTPAPVAVNSFTIEAPYVVQALYYGQNNNNTMFAAEITGTNIVGLTGTWSIDGNSHTDGSNNTFAITQNTLYERGNSIAQPVSGGMEVANESFGAVDLSDGQHTATVTIGDQSQTLNFTVKPSAN